MSNQKTEKLGLKKSLSYGMGAIGEGIGYNFFYSYFIFFMINIAGVNPAVAGTVSLIAVFWDAVTEIRDYAVASLKNSISVIEYCSI